MHTRINSGLEKATENTFLSPCQAIKATSTQIATDKKGVMYITNTNLPNLSFLIQENICLKRSQVEKKQCITKIKILKRILMYSKENLLVKSLNARFST